MENLIFTFNRILPLLVYMITGFICRKLGLIGDKLAGQLNKLVFAVFMPIYLFLSISGMTALGGEIWPMIAFSITAILLIYFLARLYYGRRNLPDEQKTVLVQAAYYSNFGLFGVALSRSLLDGGGRGITEFFIGIAMPLFNILSVLVFQAHSDEKTSFRDTLINILKNPLTDAIIMGFVFRLFPFSLPESLKSPLSNLGAMATPLALVALGASFSFEAGRKYFRQLVEAVLARLVLVPALGIGAAILLGFRGEFIVSCIAMFASPAAVASYSLAVSMDQDKDLAGQILVYSSLFCVFSLFAIIYILKSFAFI